MPRKNLRTTESALSQKTPLPKSRMNMTQKKVVKKTAMRRKFKVSQVKYGKKIGVGSGKFSKKKTARKNRRSKRSKKSRSGGKSQRISKAERQQWGHKSICQVVLLAVNSYDRPASFSQIKKLINRVGIHDMHDSRIKQAIKKMVQMRVLKDNVAAGADMNSDSVIHRYSKTSRGLSKANVMKRKRSTRKTSKKDLAFRQKMRRLAHKTNRGGRTYEQVVKDYLDGKSGDNGIYFNTVKAYLRKHHMKCSNFVLKKVLMRLREKGVVDTHGCRNFTTGKVIPPRKSTPAFLKE